MSLWQRKTLCIAVDDQACVALLRTSRHEPAQWLGVHEGPWREALPAALSAWADAAGSVQEIRIVALGRLAQHWTCAAPEGLSSLTELRAYAAARRAQQFGEGAPESWQVQGDWQAGRSFVCAALPMALKDMVHAWATACGRPWRLTTDLTDIMGWAVVRGQRSAWVGVDTPTEGRLWWVDARGGTQHLRTWAQRPEHDRALRLRSMVDEVSRAALRAGVAVPEHWSLVQWRDARLQVVRLDGSAHQVDSLMDRVLPLPPVDAGHVWQAALACHGDIA